MSASYGMGGNGVVLSASLNPCPISKKTDVFEEIEIPRDQSGLLPKPKRRGDR